MCCRGQQNKIRDPINQRTQLNPIINQRNSINQSTNQPIDRPIQVYLTGEIRDAADASVLFTEASCLFIVSKSGLLRRQSALNMGGP